MSITHQIADHFEKNLTAGDPAPEVDTIAVDLKRSDGIGLTAAVTLIEDRMAAVLRLLRERGKVGTRVTAHYVANYKDEPVDHPTDPLEIARCVAGLSRASKTVAVHFCPDRDNCVLAIGRAVHGIDSGRGAIRQETARLQVEKDAGILDGDGVAQIASATGMDRPAKPLVRQLD